MRIRGCLTTLGWAILLLSGNVQPAHAGHEGSSEDLPTDVMRIVYRFLGVSDYTRVAPVNHHWHEDLTSSHEYPIHQALHQLIHSPAAQEGSIYDQLRFLEGLQIFLESLRPRLHAAGRSDGFIQAMNQKLEKRQLFLAQAQYRGPDHLISPLIKLAQNPKLSRQGQEDLFGLAMQSHLFDRDRIWVGLAKNPSLIPELFEELESNSAGRTRLFHWRDYLHEELNRRLILYPRFSWRRQNQRFKNLTQLVLFPYRVGSLCQWARNPNLSPEIQNQIFENQLPEILALPRAAHLPFLSRLAKALANNSSLSEHYRARLAQLVLQEGVLPREEQEDLRVLFATRSASDELQEQIWQDVQKLRQSNLEERVLLGFVLNPRLSASIRKIYQTLGPRLKPSDDLFFLMAEHPQLHEVIFERLSPLLAPTATGQSPAFDESVVRVMSALVKNSALSRKAVDFLTDCAQRLEDPDLQRNWAQNLLLQPQLSSQKFEALQTLSKTQPQALYPPEWFELRRALFRVLPRATP